LRFVIATRDYAGLGFAVRLREDGNDVLVACNPSPRDVTDEVTREAYERVGAGMVEKAPLAQVIEQRKRYRDAYFIWDFNHSVEENELLRKEGFKVLGGGQFANTMEHDREKCVEFVSKYGLESPSSVAFTDTEAAIRFLEAHPQTAYVFKPDEGAKFETFLPESEEPVEANDELRAHLATCDQQGPFILQERKDGVETNVEVWFQRGEPVFAFMVLEVKKKYVLDLGPLTGCAFDYVFTIPLDARAVSESVGKLFPAYREMKYTGFADANFIAAKDGVWFFEKCERFGYNSHPNVLWTLSRKPVGDVFVDLIEGRFEPDFAEGFGASLTMSTKENAPGGKALQFPEKIARDLYLYDAFKKEGRILTAGFDAAGDVLVVTSYGFTMPTAWEQLLKRAAAVRFPYRHYRPDGDQTNYPSSPIRRYEALKAMGFI
jgi:phosphoribosylamine-glycine ligase